MLRDPKFQQVLIIEDHPITARQISSMLQSMGWKRIDIVEQGDLAIEAIENTEYQWIFCDHDLGMGKNGQQVLEEARVTGVLSETSAFVLITALQSIETVLGTLEWSPDGYLHKPLRFEEFRSRIERIRQNKRILYPIKAALDFGDFTIALKMCHSLLKAYPQLALSIYRFKASILFQAGVFDEAEKIYNLVLGTKQTDWAILGIAKTRYASNKEEDALKILENFLKNKQPHFQALDFLAEIYLNRGDHLKAMEVLFQASEIASTSVERQYRLAKICQQIGDKDGWIKASRKALLSGRFSVFKKDVFYYYAISATMPLLANENNKIKIQGISDIHQIIEFIKLDFVADDENRLIFGLLDAFYAHISDDLTGYENSINRTVQLSKLYQRNKVTSILKLPIEFEDFFPKKILHDFQDRLLKSEPLSIEYLKIDQKELFDSAELMHKAAVRLYRKRQFNRASRIFQKILRLYKADAFILLNAIQNELAIIKKSRNEKHESLFNDFNEKISKFTLSTTQSKKLDQLRLDLDNHLKQA